MMKKVILSIIIILLITASFYPLQTQAKTIREFEEEVAQYTKKLEEKQAALAKNQAEINEIKTKIAAIKSQIEIAGKEIKELEDEIAQNNKKIEQKKEESKKLIEYYQISNGNNAYLEYAFGAKSITDMVYRMSVIEQLTEYNDNLMKELKELIETNKKKQENLRKKQEQLNILKNDLSKEQEKIEIDSKHIRESMPDVQQQIKSAKANVDYYKKLGCGTNENIFSCQYRIEQARAKAQAGNGGGYHGSVPSTNGFYRPMAYGYVTQGYHGFGGHLGVDLSSGNKTIEIYPIADGVVFYKGYDKYGALVVKIKHNYNGRYIYSTYAHMSSFGNISQGQFISHNQSLGRMGSTGWSTGPHLHLEITTCDWNRGGGCTYSQYQRSTINPFGLISIPHRWSNR